VAKVAEMEQLGVSKKTVLACRNGEVPQLRFETVDKVLKEFGQ
jgi:DNA-binding Xre family transcriptional regulator